MLLLRGCRATLLLRRCEVGGFTVMGCGPPGKLGIWGLCRVSHKLQYVCT